MKTRATKAHWAAERVEVNHQNALKGFYRNCNEPLLESEYLRSSRTERRSLKTPIFKSGTEFEEFRAKINEVPKPCGLPWLFELTAFSKREEKEIIRKKKFRPLPFTRYGDYKVAPQRDSVQVFQRKFWMSREARGIVSMISTSADKSPYRDELIALRLLIQKELRSIGVPLSDLQRRLLNGVYYLLRKCKPTIGRPEKLYTASTAATTVLLRETGGHSALASR